MAASEPVKPRLTMTLQPGWKQNRPECVVAQESRHDDLHACRGNDRLHADCHRLWPASGDRTHAPQGEEEQAQGLRLTLRRRPQTTPSASVQVSGSTARSTESPSDAGISSSSSSGSEIRTTETTFSPSAVLKMVTPFDVRLAILILS